jgi:hypothetical protein
MAQKDAGVNYDPSKQNYHPIDDACWSRGDKYVAFTDTSTFDGLSLLCIYVYINVTFLPLNLGSLHPYFLFLVSSLLFLCVLLLLRC